MATPTFCVKFTNDQGLTMQADVTARDAAAAIIVATDKLLEVMLETKTFRPVEVYPVEIR